MVYEVTLFSNELDILDLKLHELDGIVDKFILVEHTYNYLRRPKRLAYNENKERFKKFHHKIIHIIDDLPYGNKFGLDLVWERNNSPLIYKALLSAEENSFVLFTDSDTLLKKDIVANLDITKPTQFHLDWYESYFNYKLLNVPFVWVVGIPIKYIKQYGVLEALKLTRGMAIQTEEFKNEVVLVKGAGYHFSKCGNLDDLLEHIKGHPHIERATNPKIANKEILQLRRDYGIMWDDEDISPTKPGIFETSKYDPKNYPEYLNQHPEIYNPYFKGGM